jgi:hypothetical protein
MGSGIVKDELFTIENGKSSGEWKIPFAVISVYAEACGGGGGGAGCNKDFDFYPDNAGAGGGGAGWGAKKFSVSYGGKFLYQVGVGGAGNKNGNFDQGEFGNGAAGTASIIRYIAKGGNESPGYGVKLEAGGGGAGGKGFGGFGGVVQGADTSKPGTKGQDAREGISVSLGGNPKNAKGGGGGGAAGLGFGARTDGKVNVSYDYNVCVSITYPQPKTGDMPYCNEFKSGTGSEDVVMKICGGGGGDGVNIGGELKESGEAATKRPGGYYNIDGKPGKLYGGGGGGASSGHNKTTFAYPDDTEGWKVSEYPLNSTDYTYTYALEYFSPNPLEEVELTNSLKNGDGADGANGFIYVKYEYEIPKIDLLQVTEQKSTGGFPRDDVIISWRTTHANEITIINTSQNNHEILKLVHDLDTGENTITTSSTRIPYPNSEQLANLTYSNGAYQFSTLQRSVAGVCSPSVNTYRLIAKGPGGEATRDINASVYNDDRPSSPNSILDTPKMEPNSTRIYNLGSLNGVDMNCYVEAVNCQFDINADGSWRSSALVENGKNLRVRVTALPFNSDENGLINIKSASLKLGRGFTEPNGN